jgi:signal transduction histidine kinase
VLDIALGAASAGECVIQGQSFAGETGIPVVLAAVLGAVAGATLVLRRRWPIVVVLVAIAVIPAEMGTVLGVVGLYTLAAADVPRRTTGLLASMSAAGVLVMAAFRLEQTIGRDPDFNPSGWFVPLVAVLMAFGLTAPPVLLGLYVGARRRLVESLRERADGLERELSLLADRAEERAEWARNEERTRIAREMHDVVAHRVSLMVVHAAALQAVALKDPEKASKNAALVGDMGRQALTELRTMLGVLRSGDTEREKSERGKGERGGAAAASAVAASSRGVAASGDASVSGGASEGAACVGAVSGDGDSDGAGSGATGSGAAEAACGAVAVRPSGEGADGPASPSAESASAAAVASRGEGSREGAGGSVRRTGAGVASSGVSASRDVSVSVSVPGGGPSLAQLDVLVGQSRAAGMAVELSVEGTPDVACPQPVQQTAYRVVQEALTNVHKHAAGAATRVRVAHRAAEVALQVENEPAVDGAADARLPSGGNGLVGMRERVTALGGGFVSGPTDAGGFRVSAIIPYARS